jgi:hypothetical protein
MLGFVPQPNLQTCVAAVSTARFLKLISDGALDDFLNYRLFDN